MRIHIKNGHLIDPLNDVDGQLDLYINAGKIIALGAEPGIFKADKTIDASGMTIIPGLVDLCARLRDPGYEYKATLESELRSAVHGGVTSLVCPPDTDPVLDESGLVGMLKQRARNQNLAQVYPLGALTLKLEGQHLTEMAALTEAGCIGFSQAEHPVVDTNVLLRALQYAKTFGYTVWLRAQDAHIGVGGVAHSGAFASRMGLSGVPVMAETIALHTLFELQRSTGAKVHVCRISSAAGVELIRQAKREGLDVSCDVGVHHLHLIDTDIGYFDANARMSPPLRSERDRDALRMAVFDGTIDAICSDHTPVDDDEKLLPFAEASPGATGLELLLSLVLKWAAECHVNPAIAIARITSDPARVAGLSAGNLSVGSNADLCIFNADAEWQVAAAALVSQGKHTPFIGYSLPATVQHTLVGGHIVFSRA